MGHRAEMRRLQADHDQKISEITELAEDFLEAKESLEGEVLGLVKEEEAERSHQQQLKELYAIEKIHYSEVARMREDRRIFEEVQKNKHAERLSVLKTQHDAEKTAIIGDLLTINDRYDLKVAKSRQDRRDIERSYESEMSVMKAAHEKQLFEVHSLLAKECYEKELMDIPRSPDSFPAQIEVEVKNETPTTAPPQSLPPINFRQGESALTTKSESSLDDVQAHRESGTGVYPPAFDEYEDGRRSTISQPSSRNIGDKVEAAMENESSPPRRIPRRTTARMRPGDEAKAVEAMPRRVSLPLTPNQPLERETNPDQSAKPVMGYSWLQGNWSAQEHDVSKEIFLVWQ
jgi:hypothetical protein